MDIRIMSHIAASNFLDLNPKIWNVVYVVNSNSRLDDKIYMNVKDIKSVCFDDIDCPLHNYVMPKYLHVSDVLDFTSGLDKVIFTCHGGWSRSSALGYVALCQEMEPDLAIEILTHKFHYPNKVVIKIASEILEKPEVYEVYKNWIKDDLAILPPNKTPKLDDDAMLGWYG